mgnify:CR=1 FL=1
MKSEILTYSELTENLIDINQYLIDLNIIDINSCKLFNDCVRDKKKTDLKNYNIKAYICTKSNVIFLKKKYSINNYYEKQNQNYWTWTTYNLFYDFERRSKYIEDIIKNKVWVDFGTGLGYMLKKMKNVYKKKYGIEVNKYCLDTLMAENIIVKEHINQIDEKIDIITMFHVLEHIENPIDILNSFYNKLTDDGKIIIEIPHANDFMLTKIDNKEYKDFILWDEHLVLHNEESITKLLNFCNFEIIKFDYIQRYPLSNNLYWCNNKKPNGHSILNFLNNTDLHIVYEDTLKKGKCTDTIILICKKLLK